MDIDKELEQPVILIVGGMPRGGTTLMADILNSQDEIALFIEYHFADFFRDLSEILRYYDALHDIKSRSTARLKQFSFDEILPEEDEYSTDRSAGASEDSKFFQIRENTDKLGPQPRYPTPENMTAIALATSRISLAKPRARVIGSKTPEFYRDFHQAQLTSYFSDIRYIILLRSPVRQINSSMNRRNHTELGQDSWLVKDVQSAIEFYKDYLRITISYLFNPDISALAVKYDDLIGDTKQELTAVGQFIGMKTLKDVNGLVEPETVETVLTSDELRSVIATFRSLILSWPKLSPSRPAEMAAAFCSSLDEVSERLVSYAGVNHRMYLGAGWSEVDAHGVWTSSDWATLVLPGEGGWVIAARVVPYLPDEGSNLSVRIRWDGEDIARFLFMKTSVAGTQIGDRDVQLIGMADTVDHELLMGPFTFKPDVAHVLQFDFNDLRSPMESGHGADPRKVALSLRSLRFISA